MVDYLRISVTDRCNLNCFYCLPSACLPQMVRKDYIPGYEILRYEEIASLVKILAKLGIKKVRLTGGEPLVRRNIENLIKMISSEDKIFQISMTTNGILLGRRLISLLHAGLSRVNISLSTLKRDRYKEFTGFDLFDKVWDSIKDAQRFIHLKVNTIILRGLNDDEIIDFAKLTLNFGIDVRFIEYFSTRREFLGLEKRFIPNEVIKKILEKQFGKLLPADSAGNGPAINYRINGAKARVGFINTNSEPFCTKCNRLRLSSDGRLYPCLFSPFSLNLKKMLRANMPSEEIKREIEKLIMEKPEYSRPVRNEFLNESRKRAKRYEFTMSYIGG
ncbi:GTP 3',8-cyclase MoaA [bacterium Unc6]|nr:GTP 3',8-cyclase MoaA [bacterium Unc6]MBT9130718.1 GTP 3',8-cyclase 1 [Candidatus Psychracetigena formicireducens]